MKMKKVSFFSITTAFVLVSILTVVFAASAANTDMKANESLTNTSATVEIGTTTPKQDEHTSDEPGIIANSAGETITLESGTRTSATVENVTIIEQGSLGISGENYSKVEIGISAKQTELESSLLNFNKIDSAQIALNFENEVNSASIVLTTNGVVSDSEIDKIVLFISKSVENLDKENIQITDQNANTIYPIR